MAENTEIKNITVEDVDTEKAEASEKKKKKEKKEKVNPIISSVLASERCMVTTDALMYGKKHDENKIVPIPSIAKTHCCTKSERLALEKQDSEILGESNIQTIENAFLSDGNDMLHMEFNVKFLPVSIDRFTFCNHAFAKKFNEVIKEYKEKYSFKELAHRYLLNMISCKWAYRNIIESDGFSVKISYLGVFGREEKSWSFDFTEFESRTSLNKSNFSYSNEAMNEIEEIIAQTFAGERRISQFKVFADIYMGENATVYPSQCFAPPVKDGEQRISKILYKNNDCVALTSDKVSNAIRSIDTWYAVEDDTITKEPLPVNPYAPNKKAHFAFRAGNGDDVYTVLDKVFEDNVSLAELGDNAHFLIANFIRGGLFGKK